MIKMIADARVSFKASDCALGASLRFLLLSFSIDPIAQTFSLFGSSD